MTSSALRSPRLGSTISSVQPSSTVAIDQRAKKMRATGTAVYNLSAGEIDIPTPRHIVQAAAMAASDPAVHHYSPTAGLPELRTAIAERTSVSTGVETSATQVLVTNGGKQAIFQALGATTGVDDEVLIPVPYWTTYPEAVRLSGAVPIPVEPLADEHVVTADALARAASERTRAVILCSPNNPNGAVYSRSELEEIAGWAVAHDIWIIADEMYQSLTYTPFEAVSILEAAPWARSHTILVNALSKSHAMTGWRIGWMTGPTPLIDAAIVMQGHLTSHVSNIAQRAAIAALTEHPEVPDEICSLLRQRRDALVEQLSEIPGLDVTVPDGAFYLFVNVSRWLAAHPDVGSSARLAELLLDEAHTATVPGEAFGAPGHLRLSFAAESTDLSAGAANIRDYLSRTSRKNRKP